MEELPLKDDATMAAINFLEQQGYSVVKSLNEIKADAIREMIDTYFSSKLKHDNYTFIRVFDCLGYADELEI